MTSFPWTCPVSIRACARRTVSTDSSPISMIGGAWSGISPDEKVRRSERVEDDRAHGSPTFRGLFALTHSGGADPTSEPS